MKAARAFTAGWRTSVVGDWQPDLAVTEGYYAVHNN
jgi:hypothetical protein